MNKVYELCKTPKHCNLWFPLFKLTNYTNRIEITQKWTKPISKISNNHCLYYCWDSTFPEWRAYVHLIVTLPLCFSCVLWCYNIFIPRIRFLFLWKMLYFSFMSVTAKKKKKYLGLSCSMCNNCYIYWEWWCNEIEILMNLFPFQTKIFVFN